MKTVSIKLVWEQGEIWVKVPGYMHIPLTGKVTLF